MVFLKLSFPIKDSKDDKEKESEPDLENVYVPPPPPPRSIAPKHIEPTVIIKEEDNKNNFIVKCRNAMKKLTGSAFEEVEPRWLYGMSLDGYNEDLMIAFLVKPEVLHPPLLLDHLGEYIKYEKKRELCEINDISVIEIPFWVSNLDAYLDDYLV